METEVTNPPFQLGETVWVAVATPYRQEEIACPICSGKSVVTLILGNGEAQPVECDFCRQGCGRSTGLVTRHSPHSEVKQGTITGLIQQLGDWRIEVSGWSHAASDIFRDAQNAEGRRVVLHAEAERQAERSFESQFKQAKKKTTWNAGYHLKEILELQRKIEWHEARLGKIKEARDEQ